MSDSPHVQTDRNLLFGVLALQVDLIDPAQFTEACTVWAGRKNVSLADILCERGWLSEADRADVERLVQRKLARHHDARAGLASLLDSPVRESIQKLPDDPIRQSLADLIATTPPTPGPLVTSPYEGEHRDRFLLQHVHASGGIGQVWLARDTELGREVALKELRPDRRDRLSYSTRFVREAQVTGQLEHPGIVPVYQLVRRPDADGGPFYVMRFIRGRTLKQEAASFHDRSTGTRGLAFRNLIQAMVAVCNTIAYAHSRGVLHRDLKGQNVVVGDYGEVLVIDWGLARLLDETESDLDAPAPVTLAPDDEHTQPGQVVGTPAYMAPEQAAGRLDLIDERTDIYGLGALLYEILTNQPPFTGQDQADTLRRVREEPPTPPRHLNPEVPGALEAICLTALCKNPADRYDSAAEMALDLQHWLADEQVSVHTEPLATRLARWARRRPALVSSALVLLLAGVIGLTTGVTLIGQEKSKTEAALKQANDNWTAAETARGLATRNAQDADLARRRAEANLRKARSAADLMLVRVSEDENLLANEPRMEQLRRRLLQDALAFFQTMLQENASNDETRLDLLQTHRRVGRLHLDLGRPDEAARAYLEAVKHCTALIESASESSERGRFLRELASIKNDLGNVYRLMGKLEDARKVLLETLQYRQTLAQRGEVEYVQELATTLYNLARVLRDLGKLADAEQAARQTVELWGGLADIPAAPPHWQQACVRALLLLSLLQEDRRDRPGQETTLLQALARQEKLKEELGPTPAVLIDLAYCHNNLGILYRKMDRLVPAEKHQTQSLAIRRQLVKDFPRIAAYRNELGSSLRSFALLRMDQDKLDEARKLLEEARTIQQQLTAEFAGVPEFRQNLAVTMLNLSLVLVLLDKNKLAEAVLQESMKNQETLIKEVPNAPFYQNGYGLSLHQIGVVCLTRKEWKKADRFFEEAIGWQKKAWQASGNQGYRQLLRMHYAGRAEALFSLKDVGTLAKLAGDWHMTLGENWMDCYDAARCLARCAALAEKPDTYAKEAVKLLSEARSKGLRNVALVRDAKAFAPLRQRADFRALVETLEGGKEK